MNRGFTRTVETDIAAPAATIHDLVADVSRHPEWSGNPLTVEHIGGPATGPGARFATSAKALPAPPKYIKGTVAVVLDAPHRVVYDVQDDSGEYWWTFALEPRDGDGGGTTHVTHTLERLSAPRPILLLQPLMWRLFGRRQVERGLRRLAAVVTHNNQERSPQWHS